MSIASPDLSVSKDILSTLTNGLNTPKNTPRISISLLWLVACADTWTGLVVFLVNRRRYCYGMVPDADKDWDRKMTIPDGGASKTSPRHLSYIAAWLALTGVATQRVCPGSWLWECTSYAEGMGKVFAVLVVFLLVQTERKMRLENEQSRRASESPELPTQRVDLG